MFVTYQDINFESYDVIIVGSGPAGSTVAIQLSQQGKRTLIIETGSTEYDDTVQTDFSTIYGRGHLSGSHWTQHWVRALGGTSMVWGGWCAPMTDRNLTNWPIARADLDPWYLKAAQILRRDPLILTYSRRYIPGFEHRPFSAEEPLHFGQDLRPVYTEDRNIHVLLSSTISGLHARSDRKAVTGFTLWSPGEGPREISLREKQKLVLAAGGIGNAQILLASRQGDGAAVGNEADQVGRYLMEHPHFYSCARMLVPTPIKLPEVPSQFGVFYPALVPDDTVYEAIGGVDVSIEPVETAPNTEDPIEVFLLERMGGAAQSYDLNVRSEMPADPMNRVTVGEGNDPSGLPRMRTTFVIGSEALRPVDHCLEALGDRLIAEGLGRLRIINDNLYWGGGAYGHIMGTTRMGNDPKTSVVDRDCRIHGYGNLYIAGSSVFTSSGYANPTLTIMALAARLADHLVGVG